MEDTMRMYTYVIGAAGIVGILSILLTMDNISYPCASVSLFAVLTGLYYSYLRYKFKYWKKKGVAFLKPSFPLGNCKDLLLFRKSMSQTYSEHYKQFYGNKYGGVYMVHIPQLLLRDPELIKAVLVKDFDHFHDHGFAADEKIDPLSGNLFMLSGAKWRDLRVKLSPTFTSGKMKMMFDTLVDSGQELKDYLKQPAKEGVILELKDLTARFSTDVIASCAFGIQCNCLKDPDAEFRHWGKKINAPTFEAIVRGILYLVLPKVAISLKIASTPNDITNFFRTMVHETVHFREKHSIQRNDFLQLLIQLKNKGKLDTDTPGQQNEKIGGMTMDEIAAQVFVFFLGGFETSSTTMSFALYELAVQPDIQKRLQEEIDRVLDAHEGKVTYEGILQMEYLDKVVSETLRKYPPIGTLNRECSRNYTLPGTKVVVDEGVQVVIPVQAIHHDPQYYPEPDKFDPERFNEEVKNKRHHYTYLPFGEGPRICIGMRFGLMQTKVGLVSILSKCGVHVCEETSIPLKIDPMQFITTSMGGIWLQIKERKK